jgi:glycosyltransferase involved in cell wall biosynthesis
VQVESMLCGTPSVCSNLPGVRVPVQTTGMGVVAPIGDANGLAEAITRVVQHRAEFVRPYEEISKYYSTERSVREYVSLYEQMIQSKPQERHERTSNGQ